MENNDKQEIGPNAKAMGEIVRYLKNYPFLLITVAGLLILVGILIFDIEKIKEFSVLIYCVVLVPIGFQFLLEFKKQGGRREETEAKIIRETSAREPHLSRKAVVSLVLSVLALLFFANESEKELSDGGVQVGMIILFVIPALVLAFNALSDARQNKVTGKGWAVAACVLSVLMVIVPLGGISQSKKTEPAALSVAPAVPEKIFSGHPPAPVQTPAIATRCVTQMGACPMMVAIPVGSSCTCTNAYGVFPGLAQ